MTAVYGWARKAGGSTSKWIGWLPLALQGWRERARLRSELDGLRQRGELDRTLSDSGIAPSDVPRLMRAHPLTPQQLSAMMHRLGIDRSALPRSAAVFEKLRAMEWRCGECGEWRKCRSWLGSAGSSETYRAFCANAEELDSIRCAAASSSGSSLRDAHGILAELEAARGESVDR